MGVTQLWQRCRRPGIAGGSMAIFTATVFCCLLAVCSSEEKQPAAQAPARNPEAESPPKPVVTPETVEPARKEDEEKRKAEESARNWQANREKVVANMGDLEKLTKRKKFSVEKGEALLSAVSKVLEPLSKSSLAEDKEVQGFLQRLGEQRALVSERQAETKILGSWRSVITNPSHPNSVARRYMRHTFTKDGRVTVEDKEDSSTKRRWRYEDGVYLVELEPYKGERRTAHYRLVTDDELENFQWVAKKGAQEKSRKEDDRWIRQGSDLEKGKKVVDIFDKARSDELFVDPNLLKKNRTYKLSNRTPLMPHHSPADPSAAIQGIQYFGPGSKMRILSTARPNGRLWYEVSMDDGDRKARGWVNVSALVGQNLGAK